MFAVVMPIRRCIMKAVFPGYYRLSDYELSELWKDCLFVLDANVLLNLYRYPEKAREDFINVFAQISNRLWVPHHVALEYQANRLNVITEQIKKFDDVNKILSDSKDNLKSKLDALQLKKRHSVIDPESFLNKVETVFDEFRQGLDLLEKEQPDVFTDDKLREQIDLFLEGRVGSL